MSNEAPAVIVEELSTKGNFSTEGSEPVEGQTPETVPQAEPPKPPQDDKFAAKFAALSRQEKQIRQKAMDLQQREAAFAAREKQLQEQLTAKEAELGQFKGFKEKIKTNPLQTLAEEGYDFEALTAMQLNEQNPTPEMLIQRMQRQMDEKYGKQLEELKAQLAEKEQKTQQDLVEQAKSSYKQNIELTVSSNPEKYELIANTAYGESENSVDLVYEVVEEFYNANKRVLDVAEAADMVEKHLEDEERKRREKLKKFKQTSPPPVAQKAGQKQTAPTLSNSLAQESPKNGPKPMSREESLREAAKLIRWEE